MNETQKAMEILRKSYRQRMNDLADTIACGDAKSFEEYKSLCGEIRGLAFAERELLDLAEQMKNHDNF